MSNKQQMTDQEAFRPHPELMELAGRTGNKKAVKDADHERENTDVENIVEDLLAKASNIAAGAVTKTLKPK